MERYINIVDYHQRKNNNQTFFDKKIVGLSPCIHPKHSAVVNKYGLVYICACASWLPKAVGSLLDYDDFLDLLNSYEARQIRSEIDLGRYSYCNHNICQYLSQKDLNISTDTTPAVLLTEDQFTESSVTDILPVEICFDFDYTCNFICPSCRTEIINENQGLIQDSHAKVVEKIKRLILDRYSQENAPLNIRWAGGEPLVSHAYLDLWEYIAELNNPNIVSIVQTNGSYLKKRSAILEKFLPYVSTLRISFDAGTADTYSRIRKNGVWEELLENCRYIKTLADELDIKLTLISDFVVQLDNFQEIPSYVNTAKLLGFDQICMGKMWNWGTWSDEEFQRLNVSNPAHPQHLELKNLIELYSNDSLVLQQVI